MLAGIVATTPITTEYAAEESETEKNQNCNIDGDSTSGQAAVVNGLECAMDNFGP